MAGFFQQFLKGVGDGFTDSAYLRDYQHASKIYTPNAYANAPKFKWLFHVYFDINKQKIASLIESKIFPSTTNYGLLVKSIDLPKYQFKIEELNQYNRKRLVQTKITYDPVRIVFHDDNANQMRQLWFNYFSYYYNDPNQPGNTRSPRPGSASAELNNRNLYDSDISQSQNWGYIGEIPAYTLDGWKYSLTKAPFFNSIRIYGFNQHNWALYELVNPMIESFGHDNYNYYDSRGIMENNMTVRYETVKYYDGALNGQDPSNIVDGFGRPSEYDTTLSPLNRPGSNRTILGQGGLVDAVGGISEDLAKKNFLGALQTASRTGLTFRNGRQILQATKAELTQEVVGAIQNSPRTLWTMPARGATTGTGQQKAGETNIPSSATPATPTTKIRPIGS